MARRRTTDNRRRAGLILAALLTLTCAPAWGAERPAPTNVGDLGHAIAALVIFALLLVLLGRFAWKPLLAQLHRREESIAEALRNSEKREAEAQQLLEEYRSRMESAEADAADVLARGRKEAARAREEVLSAAREEAAKTIAATRQEIAAAKEAALRELRAEAAEMAVDLTEQVLGKGLDDTDRARLVTQSLDAIRHQGKEAN